MEWLKYPKVPYKSVLISLVFILAAYTRVTAQDPQFSQFYAAPLYLNPAFAGATQQGRVGINYRNQWPSIDANFTTISAFADFYIEDKNSGVGALLTRDNVGLLGIQSVNFAVQYAYQLRITKGLSFRPGFQASIYNRSVNFSKLTFGDQFDPRTGEIINPTAETLRGENIFFPDIAAGGLLYTPNAWLGFAAHHLTQPNQSITGSNDRLYRKISAHVGWKYYFRPGVTGTGVYAHEQERSVAPTVQYRHQGQFDQADVGLYFTFEPIIVGTWYRGIPFKEVNGFTNNESLVILVGLTLKGKNDILNIGYSYDYTLSQLGPGSGGAHEFSLVYSWPTRNPRKPPKDKLIIPCPDF
jgi:type IX secretion system PorP/SprF family membrane protein